MPSKHTRILLVSQWKEVPMNYKALSLILSYSLTASLYGAQGYHMKTRRHCRTTEDRDFLAIERRISRSRSRIRNLSRERELSIERDRERAATMGKCIQFGTVLAKIVPVIARLIIKLVTHS